MRSDIFLLLCALCAAAYQAFFFLRRVELRRKNPQELIGKLRRLDAIDLLLTKQAEGEQLAPADLWLHIGGLRGTIELRRNVQVLLNLAISAEAWNPAHGRVLSRLVRKDALGLRRSLNASVYWYLVGRNTRKLDAISRQSVGYYIAVRARVLAIYELTNAVAFAELSEVI